MKQFHIVYWFDGLYWIASCLENHVASQGKTKEEAASNIREALELTLEDEVGQQMPVDKVETEVIELAV